METGQKTIQTNNNIAQSKDIVLSIQVSLNGLSFCVLNTEKSEIEFYKSFQFEKKLNPGEVLDRLVHQFNTQEELQQDFKNVTVVHDNELSSLVPKPLFNEDYLADYLKFNSKILRSDYITYDEIILNDSMNVYVPYVNINNYLYDRFGEFEFRHFSTIVIESILNLEKNASTTKMYAHMSTTHFEIVIIDNGQLKLYNTFEYTTKEDFIYYILFTAEQLEMNPEEFALVIIGDLTTEDEYYQIAYKYVRDVAIFQSKGTTITVNNTVDTKCLAHFVMINSF